MKTILIQLIQGIANIYTNVVRLIGKYGKDILLWGMLLLLFGSLAYYIMYMNNQLFQRFLQKIDNDKQIELVEDNEAKEEAVQQRRDINNKVYQLLYKFFYSHDCVQDVAIMEYHNTYKNLSNKSFLYLSNTFEICKYNDSHFADIQHINISLFNISNILYVNQGYYHSDLPTLKKNDSRLYSFVYNVKEGKYIYIKEIKKDNNTMATGALIVISNQPYSNNLQDTINLLEEKISLFIA